MKVDIIGTYPPPIGGTSIHLQRLYDICIKEGMGARILDTHGRECTDGDSRNIVRIVNYKKFLLKYFFDVSADIIHSHSHSWVERMILTLKAKMFRQKIVFTFHSFRDEYSGFSLLQKMSVFMVKKLADYFIATSSHVKDKLSDWGVSERKLCVINPFILPSSSQERKLDGDIEKKIENFSLILCANASNNEHYDGEDLYGLDMCIDLQAKMKEKYNCCFVYVLTKITDKAYLKKIKRKIDELELNESFLLVTRPIDFLALISRATICIRPTNTDSWALTISEALHLGCPVVASDVHDREKGCVLFKSRCQQDLNEKVDAVLSDLQNYRVKLQEIHVKDESNKIFDIYRGICNGNERKT